MEPAFSQNGLSDLLFPPNFPKQLELYFKNHKTDSIEGLYTISDDLIITPPWYAFSNEEHKVKNHWAKVALIRDSTSLSRDYFEWIIEAPNFKEAEVRSDFLRTKQNPSIFISKQLNYDKSEVETMMFEFISDGEMLTSEFEYQNDDTNIKLKRHILSTIRKSKCLEKLDQGAIVWQRVIEKEGNDIDHKRYISDLMKQDLSINIVSDMAF